MKLLFSAVVLGITGFDPLGIPIIIGALSANADKKAITTFTLTVLFGSVISGTFMSVFLGNNISFLANFFGKYIFGKNSNYFSITKFFGVKNI
ncbi:MAG: hypothetical protein ACFNVV_07245 [Bacteroidota bacterium]